MSTSGVYRRARKRGDAAGPPSITAVAFPVRTRKPIPADSLLERFPVAPWGSRSRSWVGIEEPCGCLTQFHQVKPVTIRIRKISATKETLINDLERNAFFLELGHGPVEILYLEPDGHGLRRSGGRGLPVRMQSDHGPRRLQFDPFVTVSDLLPQAEVVPIE